MRSYWPGAGLVWFVVVALVLQLFRYFSFSICAFEVGRRRQFGASRSVYLELLRCC